MPMGCLSLVPHVANILEKQKPNRVLDLGIGMGFYGAVVRQWVDRGIMPWKTELIGVEAFEGYRNPCWQLYDRVFTDEIMGFLKSDVWLYEVILMMDVLEHFPLPQEVIKQAKQSLTPGGKLIIGTPAVWMEQGAAYGNEFERHRSLVTLADLDEFEIICDGSTDEFGCQMLLGVYSA